MLMRMGWDGDKGARGGMIERVGTSFWSAGTMMSGGSKAQRYSGVQDSTLGEGVRRCAALNCAARARVANPRPACAAWPPGALYARVSSPNIALSTPPLCPPPSTVRQELRAASQASHDIPAGTMDYLPRRPRSQGLANDRPLLPHHNSAPPLLLLP